MERFTRQFAIACAVVHYGLGNLAQGSKPPNINTLLQSADKIREYVEDGKLP